jgi:phosphoglucosamine mutase
MKFFGTDGIRGRVNEFPITAEIALRVGKATAQALRSKGRSRNRVLVGKDTRISGYMLETALTSGLVSMGMDVFLVGPLPTPAVAHLTKSMGASAGIMITASHNPYEDNGMKIFGPDGFKLSDSSEALIERLVLGEEPESAPLHPREIGKAQRIEDARGRYIEFAKQTADNISLHGLRIVVDCGHGAAYFIAPLIFKELGAEVITAGVQPDGLNINSGCGALHPEHAGELVRRHGADLGISFDGDADRVIFTDARGETVSGDRILALCAIGLKEQGKLRNDTLVATVMSNPGLKEAMRSHGIRMEATAVGDRNVIECIRSGGHSFGGESSGHVIFADHATTGDGIVSALQVLAALVWSEQSLVDYMGDLRLYPQVMINHPLVNHLDWKTHAGFQRVYQDVSRAIEGSGRVLIRPSGTEPVLRIMVESPDEAEAQKYAQALADALT